jgi:hypothetical protein
MLSYPDCRATVAPMCIFHGAERVLSGLAPRAPSMRIFVEPHPLLKERHPNLALYADMSPSRLT